MKNGYIRIHCIRLILTALLLLACTPAPAQDAGGIRLTDSTSLSPFVEASLSYDSNVLLLGKGLEQEDFYLDLVGGLSLLRKKEASTLNLRGWYQARRYEEFRLLDDETWQINGEYVGGYIDRAQLILKAKYGVLSDYEFTQSDLAAQFERSRAGDFMMETRTMRYRRILDSYSVGLARESRRFDLSVHGIYSSVDFDTDKATLYDWTEIFLQPRIGLRVSEKTSVTLGGEIGQQDSENDLNTLDFLRVRLGLYLTPSEKTKVDFGAGYQESKVDATSSSGSSLDTEKFHFDGNASWMATSKILLHVFAKNEILPTEAFQRNTKQVDQASVGGTYEITHQFYASLGLTYRRDEYTAPVRGVDDPLEELIGIQARLAFNSQKRNLGIYLKGRYEEFTSNIQTDYDQLRVSIGLNFAF